VLFSSSSLKKLIKDLSARKQKAVSEGPERKDHSALERRRRERRSFLESFEEEVDQTLPGLLLLGENSKLLNKCREHIKATKLYQKQTLKI